MNRNSIPWTMKQISKMYDNGSLTFDNEIQRNFVWTKEQMSILIDSIIRNYPVPTFYAIKTSRTVKTPKGDVKVFDCIDGKQRCTTINQFKNNKFTPTGCKTIMLSDGSEFDINEKTYDELPDELKKAFDNYSLTVCVLSDMTDEEITEVMRRLNNGKPLSPIDLTRIKAKDLAGISSLGKHPLFKQCLSEKAYNSRHQEDIIIKTWVQLTADNPSLDNKDIRKVYENLEITPDVKNRLTAIFDMILATYDKIVSVSKKTAKKITMKTHLVSVSYIIDRAINNGNSVDDIAAYILDFFPNNGKPSKSDKYNAACKDGSNHAVNVNARLDALSDAYDDFVSAKNSQSTSDVTN